MKEGKKMKHEIVSGSNQYLPKYQNIVTFPWKA